MNSDEQSPDELQRMLALKRHETPPPRFFRNFSDRVIDQLSAPEAPPPPTLRGKLGLDIDSRPVLVCGSGILVCGLLVVGLIASLRIGPPKSLPRPASEQTYLIFTPQPSVAPTPVSAEDPSARTAASLPGKLDDPVSVPSSSPFSAIALPQANPATTPASTGKAAEGKK